MPLALLELSAELVILCDVEVNIPLGEDVPRMDVLLITLPSDLGDESHRVIWFLRSGGG